MCQTRLTVQSASPYFFLRIGRILFSICWQGFLLVCRSNRCYRSHRSRRFTAHAWLHDQTAGMSEMLLLSNSIQLHYIFISNHLAEVDWRPPRQFASWIVCFLSGTKIGLVLLRRLRDPATSRNMPSWHTACLNEGDCYERMPGNGRTPPIHGGIEWIGFVAPIDWIASCALKEGRLSARRVQDLTNRMCWSPK